MPELRARCRRECYFRKRRKPLVNESLKPTQRGALEAFRIRGGEELA